MTWLLVLVGVVVGVFSGVVGIGGGILFVPALVWLLGMNQHRAQGTSLGALLAPVGLFAFLEYYRKGSADIRVAALLAVVAHEGLLERMQMMDVGGQRLDRLDRASVDVRGQHRAAFDRAPIEHHRARAAASGTAADVRTGQPNHLAQQVGQYHPVVGLEPPRLPVYRDRDCGAKRPANRTGRGFARR